MSKNMTPGEYIKEFRTRKGLTQKELGEIIGVNASTISKIETGKRELTIEELTDVAKKLDLNINDLLLDKRQIEGYVVNALDAIIKKFVRITTVKEYFKSDHYRYTIGSEELIIPLLVDRENPLILQMDKNLLDFARNIAEAAGARQKLEPTEYKNRIKRALRQLNKSKPDEDEGVVNSYCLISIQDIECIIKKAEEGDIAVLQAEVEKLQAEVEELQTEVERLQTIEGVLNEEGGGMDDFRRQIEAIKSILGYGSREIKLNEQDSPI